MSQRVNLYQPIFRKQKQIFSAKTLVQASLMLLGARNLAAAELLAGMYIHTGRLVEATDLLKEGVRLAPGHTVLAKLYARVLVEQGEAAAAARRA